MNATEKQINFIVHFIETNRNEYEYFETIWEQTPKNNDDYPDQRADYTRLILSKRLSMMTRAQADYFIKAYLGTKGYHQIKGREILLSILK